MERIGGILFWCGFIIACSDGEWFPYINYIGAFVAVMGAIGMDSPVKPENDNPLRGEGK